MLCAELDHQLAAACRCAFNRELRDSAELVFDLHWQFIMGKDVAGMREDFGELAGMQPVLDVIVHPRLQEARLLHPPRAAAVDEAPGDMAHLRDVKVRGDRGSVRQMDRERQCGVALKGR